MPIRRKAKIPLIALNMPSKEDYEKTLLSILKNTDRSGYHTPDIVHRELLFRSDSLATIISEIKNVQWKVTNYSVVLSAALVGVCRLLELDFTNKCLLVIPTLIFGALIGLLLWYSLRMIGKTQVDLLYYRAHMKLNEFLLGKSTAIAHFANEYIKVENEALRDRPDFAKSARANYIYFTNPFYVVISISGIIASGVIGYLLWK